MLKNSILFLTWQVSDGECKDEYKMIKDNSKNFRLDGKYDCADWARKVSLKKTTP